MQIGHKSVIVAISRRQALNFSFIDMALRQRLTAGKSQTKETKKVKLHQFQLSVCERFITGSRQVITIATFLYQLLFFHNLKVSFTLKYYLCTNTYYRITGETLVVRVLEIKTYYRPR